MKLPPFPPHEAKLFLGDRGLFEIADGGTLSQRQAEQAIHQILRGDASPEATAGLLMGLRARGEPEHTLYDGRCGARTVGTGSLPRLL